MLLEELERELRAERPAVDPEYVRRLDEWADAGFPRGSELDPRGGRERQRPVAPGWLGRIRERLAATPPRRLLAPSGAALTLVVVGAVAISQSGGLGGAEDEDSGFLTQPQSPFAAEPAEEDGKAGPLEAAPSPLPDAAGDAAAQSAPEAGAGLSAGGAALGQADASRAAESAREIGPAGRKVAQRVDLALATPPEAFREAADGVLDVVRDHRGFVVRSSVSGGDPGLDGAQQGNASFQLRIPAARLQDALAALSDLGHIVSRTDGTVDITSRFTSATARIEELTRERSRLLTRLEDADTRAERQSIRAQLRIVGAQLSDAEDDLARAQTRVQMVRVSVSITADPTLEGEDSDGSWGIDDAVDDAGDVLRFGAGVAVVSAAVLVPLALIALLAWAVAARARHRARERALDAPSL